MDMLVEQTHDLRYEWRNNERPLRFTDTRVDEQSRGISLKSTPMSLILGGSNGKSFLMNMVDTPGGLLHCHAFAVHFMPKTNLQHCYHCCLTGQAIRLGCCGIFVHIFKYTDISILNCCKKFVHT